MINKYDLSLNALSNQKLLVNVVLLVLQQSREQRVPGMLWVS